MGMIDPNLNPEEMYGQQMQEQAPPMDPGMGMDPAMMEGQMDPAMMGMDPSMMGMMQQPEPDPLLQLQMLKEQVAMALLNRIMEKLGEPQKLNIDVEAKAIYTYAQAFKTLTDEQPSGGLDPEMQFALEQEKVQAQIELDSQRFDLERERMQNEMQLRQMEVESNLQLKQEESQTKLQVMQQQAQIKADESELKQEQSYLDAEMKREQHDNNLMLQQEQHVNNEAARQQELSIKEKEAKSKPKKPKDK